MDDIFEADNIVAGQPVIVISVSNDRQRFNFRYPNGNVGYATNSAHEFSFDVGDIVLIDGNQFHLGDASMWSEPIRVGVIRRIYADRLLIEDNYSFHLVPNREPDTAKVGQTVVYGDIGVRETLQDTPIRLRIGTDDMETDRISGNPPNES